MKHNIKTVGLKDDDDDKNNNNNNNNNSIHVYRRAESAVR